jgi:hypothetical protein
MQAICFRCSKKYESFNVDDLEGDGKCPPCKKLSIKIAFDVDMRIAERRRTNPLMPSRFKEYILKEGPIKAREIGITFGD